jgi:hypothetical protein
MTETDLILLAYQLSLWADPYEMEAELEAAFDASGLDLGHSDYCTPYGKDFAVVDMAAAVLS